MILVHYFKILIVFGITVSNSPLQNRQSYTHCLSTQTYFKNLVVKDLTPENNWQAKMVSAEVSMVLFYVPWDEESLLAISIFNDLANSYYNTAYLFAVNCWEYKQYCTNFFDESRWPSLRVYIKGKTKIQFNGLWTTPSLVKFIDSILVPLRRIQNDYDISIIDKSYAHLVIGFFSNSDSREYQLFVHSSLKWLEIDPYQSTRFAVYIDPTIKTPIVSLMNGYSSQMMQINERTTLYDINTFVLRKSNTSLHWNNPREQIKTLASLALNGPVILLIYYNDNQKHQCMLKSDYNLLCQMSCHKFIKRIEEVFKENSSANLFLKTCQVKTLTHNNLMGVQMKPYIPSESFASCRYENSLIYNKTTSYFVINADVYDDLLFQLVGNGLKTTNKSFIIAIDNKDEAVYTLTKNNTLSSFVDDLYGVNLTPQAKHVDINQISVQKEDEQIASIIDINTATFLEMLSSNNSTLVAAMYSTNCPLCTHLLHTLLQVSIRLKVKEVQFVRINTDNNDVPWKYNVQNNPTLYVFPKNMSMDSRVFPHNVKINFRNVLMFILLYLDSSELMIATVNICQQMHLSSMSGKCMKFAERFFYNEVNQQLMSWQIYETKRTHILQMLQTLKAIGNNLLKVY